MIARARCRKWGEVGRFDGGDVATAAEAQGKLDSAHIRSCPFGHHVEMADILYEVLEPGRFGPDYGRVAEQMAPAATTWTTTNCGDGAVRSAFGLPGEVRGRVRWTSYGPQRERHGAPPEPTPMPRPRSPVRA